MLLKNLLPANDYHRFASQALEPFDLLFVARIRQVARGLAPGELADIGTATALVPMRLAAERAFARWHFIGVDLDAAMLEEGRLRVDELGLSDCVELKVGDALALPFADGGLAMAVSRATLHHLPDKGLALREMLRVLRPGGVGLIQDMRRDAPAELLERFTQMRAAANYPPTHLEEKLTLDEARAVVAAAGLERQASVTVVSPATGPGAMGFEMLLRKPPA